MRIRKWFFILGVWCILYVVDLFMMILRVCGFCERVLLVEERLRVVGGYEEVGFE